MNKIPYNSSIDDPTYVFRCQSIRDLQHMQKAVGPYLAPCRHATITYPHAVFIHRNASLKPGRSLYNLSVWRNEQQARNETNKFGRPGVDYVLLRIPRRVIERSSLICADDDMLPGTAFLLFEEGDYVDGQIYGPSRLPWEYIEMTDPVWRPLKIYPKENLSAVDHALAVTYRQSHNFLSDVGVPAIELVLRDTLQRLYEAKNHRTRVPRWQWKRRAHAAGVFDSLDAQWKSYCMSRNPAVNAALQRLKSSVPDNHPWIEWI